MSACDPKRSFASVCYWLSVAYRIATRINQKLSVMSYFDDFCS